jgi:MFS transporter, DHA2 family, multidrug resistance protein
MRNLGGAVGLAAIYTFLNDRSDLHLARLHEALNSAYRPALEALDTLTSRFQSYGYGADAKAMALKQLFAMAHQEGIVMAFSDVFLALTALFAAVSLGTIMMRRPSTLAVPGSGD